MNFFGHLAEYETRAEPNKVWGTEACDDSAAAKAKLQSYMNDPLNWQMKTAIEHGYPKYTTSPYRTEGFGQFLDIRGECHVVLKEILSENDYKSFVKACNFWEMRHIYFLENLPDKAKTEMDDLLDDPNLGEAYEARWGFQQTNFAIAYLARKLLELAHLETNTKLNEFNQLKQREGQSGMSYFTTVLNFRKGLNQDVPVNKRPTDSDVVNRIVLSLIGYYADKLGSEDYTKWTLQHLERRLKLLDKHRKDSVMDKHRRARDPHHRMDAPRNKTPKWQFQQSPRGTATSSASFNPPRGFRRIQCNNCNEYGHISRDCKKPRKDGNGKLATSQAPKAGQGKPVFAVPAEKRMEPLAPEDEIDSDDSSATLRA